MISPEKLNINFLIFLKNKDNTENTKPARYNVINWYLGS